ncbi:hypothetical protein MAR_009264 [Mya arenaria]|uniref:Uncharacterized protein n=1 Tax=Mya arenaria TaxID=6604 RepID=A0ABY7E184_MYAAR|nr:hypothetical protein MAR_009264 [Mya arenaria]
MITLGRLTYRSLFASNSTGIIWNNEMNDFTTQGVLVKTLLLNVSFNEVGDSKRLHQLLFENSISIERDFSKGILDELLERGHKTTEFTGNIFSVLEAISVSEEGEIAGYADPRKPSGKASYVFKTVKSRTKS